jgi:hypothetical protein
MAVISYVPPKKEIIDRRSPEGNYYVAKCDLCGTDFYPKRKNAKFCSVSCMKLSFRNKQDEMKRSGNAPKKKVVPGKVAQMEPSMTKITGVNNLYSYVKGKISGMHGRKDEFMSSVRNLDIGKIYKIENAVIKRLSSGSWGVHF